MGGESRTRLHEGPVVPNPDSHGPESQTQAALKPKSRLGLPPTFELCAVAGATGFS